MRVLLQGCAGRHIQGGWPGSRVQEEITSTVLVASIAARRGAPRDHRPDGDSLAPIDKPQVAERQLATPQVAFWRVVFLQVANWRLAIWQVDDLRLVEWRVDGEERQYRLPTDARRCPRCPRATRRADPSPSERRTCRWKTGATTGHQTQSAGSEHGRSSMRCAGAPWPLQAAWLGPFPAPPPRAVRHRRGCDAGRRVPPMRCGSHARPWGPSCV